MKYGKIIVLGLIGTLVVTIGVLRIVTASHMVYSSEISEDGYVVKMYQNRANIPSRREVYVNANTENRSIIDSGLIFSGDTFDDTFDNRQPQKFWLRPDIFDFGSFRESGIDSLEIENMGHNVLDYVFIQTQNDRFIIFDLQPKAKRRIQFNYDGVLSVQSRSSTGEKFGKAVTGDEKDKPEKTVFLVRISNTGTAIDSTKYRIRETDCCFYRW